MKKFNFLSLILVCVLTAFLIISFKVVFDDEDSVLDIFCNIDGSFRCEEIFASILSPTGIVSEHNDIAISPKSFMAYLERQEKSPPANSMIFSIV
jgi:hypothetical protein